MGERRPRWRVLTGPAADGAWNLALDEALLDACATSPCRFPPTLRLYGWQPAAVSLGRGQPAAESHSSAYLRCRGFHLTRRATGGAAVLHQHERTYSIVAPLRSETFPGGVVDTYARIAGGLLRALRRLGVDARIASQGTASRRGSCFAGVSAQEIATPRGKLVGSAQLRRRGAFLQHGSILLSAERAAWRGALDDADADAGLTSVEDELGRRIAPPELDEALRDEWAAALGVELRNGELSRGETIAATRLRSFKYLSAAWTMSGSLPG